MCDAFSCYRSSSKFGSSCCEFNIHHLAMGGSALQGQQCHRVQSGVSYTESLLGNATVTNLAQTVYTVEDLTPGTSYQLRVIPVTSIGDGPPTNVDARTGTYYASLSNVGITVFLYIVM